ncbi:type IV secretory system conjugative DNA transfer family protein [Blautia producta]|uniref:VirD4-like conjugal transfer protein, CD1115 family n=1 Tax=Blautia producta TaxID=33035 RepID=UPI001D007DB7|nr:type IV secretory system conjugative DNA transfer family protein [Blautia producta]MCB5873918.1 type IV secretory system conjugative DNA transfer family protein [Blautia producta]
MRHHKWIVIFVFPSIGCILYLGGYITQFIHNYQSWTDAGNLPGNGTSPVIPSMQPDACLRALTWYPYNIYGILICLVAFALFLFLFLRMGYDHNGSVPDKERNLSYSAKGTYGTSGFMTSTEMHQVLKLFDDVSKTKGIILGKMGNKAVCLPEKTRMNRNVAVYGASGSMKSRAYVRNAVFQCVTRGESLILTDPKSELYEDLAVYLENKGYTVKVFNLVNPENADSWNCLCEIGGQETMAQIFCDVIIQNTGAGKGDHFWDNAELNLLKALVLYVEQGFPPEAKNIGQVYKLLTMSSEKELNALFELLPVSHPAKVPYCIYKQASETVRSGVIIGLGSRLQIFQNKIIRQITSYDEIDLTLPGREKCAYFCIVSDQDHSFDFLSSLFLSFIFIKLVRYADTHGEGGALPVPVHILADELGAASGTILDLPTKISVIRSRAISISCIFQNLPQMQNRYPFNAWQEILGNCDSTVFLGCTDPITAQFISDRTGIASVNVTSEAKQLNSWRVSDYTPEYRKTESIGKRAVLTPDEVLRLPLDEELIILRGQKVLKAQKFDYILHPESKKLVKRRASEHIPAWREQRADEIDYTPSVPKAKRPVKKKKPFTDLPLTENSKHRTTSHTYNDEPLQPAELSDLSFDQFPEDEDDMILLDKDSIMS